MDTKKLVRQLYKISNDMEILERSIAYAYLETFSISYSCSDYFEGYFSLLDESIMENVIYLFHSSEIDHNIQALVEIFEQLVSVEQRKGNGVVYTPINIKDYIIKSVINSEGVPTVCDPACGCGSFLISAADYMHERYNLTYSEILSHYIYGIDIDHTAIQRVKLLFNIMACEAGECLNSDFSNFLCADALDKNVIIFMRKKVKNGFDCVIGNPPYVRSRNMNDFTKKNLVHWDTAKNGNVDLYIPFYEVGLELLNPNGKLGYISTNTFIQSVNGRSLRTYFKAKSYDITISDFRETQVFPDVTSYTCITLVDKSNISGKLHYALLNGKRSLNDYSFTDYAFKDFHDGAPWRLCDGATDSMLRAIETAGTPLDEYKIRNGLATLKNDIFFFTPTSETDDYYIREYNGDKWKIEKTICIDVVKPNILKSEDDLPSAIEKAIFPYTVCGNQYIIIPESTIANLYPYTYSFLLSVKSILNKRDKGKGNYPAWYAYGRMQGVNNSGKKLLIPYIAGKPIAVISKDEQMLFYCGYAIFSDSEEELHILKRFLESSVFWFYILHTSKPYAKGYMSLAKNYIKSFSIPVITEEQKQYILSNPPKDELDDWIAGLYGLKSNLLGQSIT